MRPDARAAALYVLSRCRRFDAWSQQTVRTAAEKFSLDARDASLCTRLCAAVLQNAALLDYYINCYSTVPTEKMEPKVRDILRLGAVQLLLMDRIPVSAAVNESVRLAKENGGHSAPLVNAVLRRISENREKLPEIPEQGSAKELSIRFSHPLWLCERMTERYGYDFAKAYFAENNREPGLTLSVNLCRTDRAALIRKLTDAGIDCAESAVSPLSVDVYSGCAVTVLPGFAEGEFFVQDAAASLAVHSAGVREGMRVLDSCAAPGGKSFLCASLMHGNGDIVSCDLHEKKLSLIEEGAERLGLACIRTAPMDASKPYAQFAGQFDLVFADVPCSGLGVIRKKPEIRYKDEQELSRLPEIQQRILAGISACVRPGGTLVYSTCTILKEENDDVVEAFLRGNPEFSEEYRRTIWPQENHTDGFFISRLKRNA